MDPELAIEPLTAERFAAFGDVIALSEMPDFVINQGYCNRFHDLARLESLGAGARLGISLFQSQRRTSPYMLDMMERHPLGSQAFLPMSMDPFLVTVAPDEGGRPGRPLAFMTAPGQGVNYHAGTWHGVLTALHGPGLFAVIDRVAGAGENLEEYWFEAPYSVAWS